MSNHLHWLARDRPNGHNEWDFLDEAGLNYEYRRALSSLDKTDTLLATASA